MTRVRGCVLYIGDTVGDREVAAARARVGTAPTTHIAAEGTTWMPSDGLRAASVPSARSEEYRRDLGRLVDDLVGVLTAGDVWPARLDRRVLDTARFEWVEALVRLLHPVWAVRRLLDEGYDHVVVVAGPETLDAAARAGLLAVAREEKGHGRRVEVVGSLAVARERRAGLRPWLSVCARAARAVTGPVVRPAVRRNCAMFVERYPAGTAVAARVAAAVGDHDSATALLVTTSEAAARAVGDGVTVVDEGSAARRRARIAALRAELCVRRRAKVLAGALAVHAPPGWRAPLAAAAPALARSIVAAWSPAASHLALLTDLVDGYRPFTVATSSYTGSHARAAVLLARERGVPTAYIQHGPLFHFNYGTNLVHDRYLVWGDRDRRALTDRGVPLDAVVVTGCPTMEHVSGRRDVPRSASAHARASLRVLYLPSRVGGGLVSEQASRAMLDAVVDATRKVEGAKLVVKVHPRDASALFDGLDGVATVVRDGDVVDAILEADAVIASTSTAGLEACALDRPLLVLAFPGVDMLIDYEGYGAALIATDAGAVIDGLHQLAEDAARRERLAEGRRLLVDDLFAGLAPGAPSRSATALVGGVSLPAVNRSAIVHGAPATSRVAGALVKLGVERQRIAMARAFARSAVGGVQDHRRYREVERFCMFVGHARNGSTLVGALLNAHPDMVIAHELDAIRYVRAGFRRSQLFWLLIERDDLFTNQLGARWEGYDYRVPGQWQGRRRTLRVLGDKRARATAAALADDPRLLDQVRQRVGAPVQLVHVVRNPYDNLATIYHRKPNPRPLDDVIDAYETRCRAIERLSAEVGPDVIRFVHNERLLENPRSELGELCTWLGVDAEASYLEACATRLFSAPNRSRGGLDWSACQVDRVRFLLDEFEFLAPYRHDEPVLGATS